MPRMITVRGHWMKTTKAIVREKYYNLMTNVLENERNLGQSNFGTEQIIMVILQFTVREVVPPER